MKRSYFLAFAILVAGAVPALFQHRTMAELKRERRELLAGARAAGVLDDGGEAAGGGRSGRVRPGQGKEVAAIEAELAGLARELAALEAGDGAADGELQQRVFDLMSRVAGLDASGIRRVLERLGSEEGLDEDLRRRLIGFSLLALADERPQTALAVVDGIDSRFGRGNLAGQAVSAAMKRWAEEDPAAAVAWMKERQEKGAQWVDDTVRGALVAGVAAADPARAFGLIGQLGFQDQESALHAVMMSGGEDPARRTAVLGALRGHLAGMADESARRETAAQAIGLLAGWIAGEKFEEVTKWIGTAGLTADEKTWFADGLTWFETRGETGRWVEWLGQNVPAAEVGDSVRELVGEWTQQDYVAAGRWLAAMSEGPARAAAVEGYAAAVAEYEPRVAEQWALTLAEGPERQATLRAVYENWPQADPDGAADFARRHGLEE